MKWFLYSDGASRGNPGPSGAGALLINEKGEEFPLTFYLGIKTNNQAEYEALLLGLRELKKRGAQEVEVRADSELLIKQLNGIYRVKHENIIPLFQEAKEISKAFKKISFQHIPREENKQADRLSNEAIDFRNL